MRDVLPGTTVEADLRRPDAADMLLSPLFLTGGLMLSQVSQLTGLEPYVIQNWVKRGFVSPPERKKYSRRQFCRILFINMLKDVLQLEKICQLLSYVNGALADESDDLVDDSYLYTCLVRLLGRLEETPMPGDEELVRWCDEVLFDYGEPCPGARRRVSRTLRVLFTAYESACLKRKAEGLIQALEEPGEGAPAAF
ncbi:DUF1836 domain-containing protein [Pseudoflavonifractor capillosus]|uniref:DUF1836 domain-containing protein n=1 Tax=Pseudoflavonifractor capillosus TaxID=106588 RepID=A0A921MPI4_9FIRM|nr:DUF1836 domain-containing protein [Pseudoflavonifractor capillosus]HJG87776.1 DUF1836 domain-containing protein [Pseudoflavonifractor capillosus]